MVLAEREKWIASEVPKECPVHAQPSLELFA